MLAPCHLRYWSWQPAFRCLLFGRKIYFLWVKWIYGQFYASVKIYEFFNGRRNIENLNFITSLGDNIQLPTLNMTNPSANCGTHIIDCNLLYFNLILRTFHLLILAPSLVTCQKQRFCLVSQTIASDQVTAKDLSVFNAPTVIWFLTYGLAVWYQDFHHHHLQQIKIE